MPKPLKNPAHRSEPHRLDTVWTRANNGEVSTIVWSDPNADGLPLKCTEHPKEVWCQDLQGVISQSIDAEQLWNTGPGAKLMIPIMPTENVFENVTLQEVDAGDGMCEVYWQRQDGSNDTVFLGFFSPGQGRIMLRELIVNQLEVELAEINQCNSPNHGVQAERSWQRSKSSTKEGFVDKYHVMKFGKCRYCFHHMLSSGIDDLIPDTPESDAPRFWNAAKAGADKRAAEREAERAARAARSAKARGYGLGAVNKDPKDFTPVFSPVSKDDKTGEMF